MFDPHLGFDPANPPNPGPKGVALNRMRERLAEMNRKHSAKQKALRAMAKRLTEEARQRALEEGVPFDLTEDYVVEQLSLGCPVLGVEFDLDAPHEPHAPHSAVKETQ